MPPFFHFFLRLCFLDHFFDDSIIVCCQTNIKLKMCKMAHCYLTCALRHIIMLSVMDELRCSSSTLKTSYGFPAYVPIMPSEGTSGATIRFSAGSDPRRCQASLWQGLPARKHDVDTMILLSSHSPRERITQWGQPGGSGEAQTCEHQPDAGEETKTSNQETTRRQVFFRR